MISIGIQFKSIAIRVSKAILGMVKFPTSYTDNSNALFGNRVSKFSLFSPNKIINLHIMRSNEASQEDYIDSNVCMYIVK